MGLFGSVAPPSAPSWWAWQATFKPAMWLDEGLSDVRRALVCRAMTDIGICENPPGSNRSGRIDGYFQRLGVPIGQFWCAAWLAQIWTDVGLETPEPLWRGASCDEWMKWGKDTGRFIVRGVDPEPGDAVLYGTTGDAHHIELLARLAPYPLTVGANRPWSGYGRNGEAVMFNRADTARIIGYVRPILP